MINGKAGPKKSFSGAIRASLISVGYFVCLLSPWGVYGQEQTVLFDFGRHDTSNGAVVSTTLYNSNNTAVGPGTAVGDSVSYVWNSLGGTNQTQSGSGVSFGQFRDQNGTALSWVIGNLSNPLTQANGFQNGGLKLVSGQGVSKDPTNALLGKFAVPNATGDYWFVDNTGTRTNDRAGFLLTGLDVGKRYRFTLFGSRYNTGNRYTRYLVSGYNSASGFLQTSGTDIGAGNGVGTDTNKYDGNDARTLTLPSVTPMPDGTISVAWLGRADTNFSSDFSTDSGSSFGYLNFMQVEVFPAGHTAYLVDIGGDATTASVGGELSPSTNGVFWNNSAGPADGPVANLSSLVSSEGLTSNISLTWTATGKGVGGALGGWGVSFGPNGTPLNTASAFKDGIYVDATNSARFVLGNLNVNASYRLEFFGSRSATSEVRATKYRVAGAVINELVQTNSGTDVGGPGIPYNRSLSATEMFPAADGTLSVEITVQQGTYGYLNAFSLSATVPTAVVAGQPTTPPSILIDFGGTGATNQIGSGIIPTSSPDFRGFYWNNSSGGQFGRPSDISNMVDQLNQPSGISLAWGSWGVGVASVNLGVSTIPASSPLYGFQGSALGVASAMQDGIYTVSDVNDNFLTLSGMDPAKQYDLSIFASRDDSSGPRYSDYLVRGAWDTNRLIQTSGPNVGGSGIHYNVTPWDCTMVPDSYGNITIYYRGAFSGPAGAVSGTNAWAYLNAMAIRVSGSTGTNTNPPVVTNGPITTFAQWRSVRAAAWGWSGNQTNAMSDPDGNGMNNLMEYCLLADPTNAAARSIRPVLSDSNGYLTLSYLRRTNDASVAIRAEYSSSLGSSGWIPETVTNGPVAVATNSVPGDEGVEVLVRAPVPKNSGSRGYLRAVASQPVNRVLVVGSSTMAYWTTMTTDLAPIPVLNQAVAGTVTTNWLSNYSGSYWSNRVVSQTNPALIYYCGSNDIGNSSSTPAVPSATIVSNTVAFFQDFWARYPDSPAIYLAVQKAPIKKTIGRINNVNEVNNLMKAWVATQPRARYVDTNPVMVDTNDTALPGMFLSDNLHPSAAGYAAMKGVILPVLKEMWYYQVR